MQINVGSKNKAKVEAVQEILQEYPHLADAAVETMEVPSNVEEQPKSLEKIIEGARNRAKSAFVGCEYAIGIESGFMPVPHTKSGYMNTCVCAIYDGTEFHIGISSSFETPDREIMRLVVEDGLTFAEAGNRTKITSDPDIGKHEGIVSLLTKGKVTRKEYTKQALRMALVHIDIHNS